MSPSNENDIRKNVFLALLRHKLHITLLKEIYALRNNTLLLGSIFFPFNKANKYSFVSHDYSNKKVAGCQLVLSFNSFHCHSERSE